MVIELTIKNVIVYKKLQKSFMDRQSGKEVPYYQLVLDQNDNVETFSCTENAYSSVETGKPCVLCAEFNTSTTGAKIRVTGVDSPNLPDVPTSGNVGAKK